MTGYVQNAVLVRINFQRKANILKILYREAVNGFRHILKYFQYINCTTGISAVAQINFLILIRKAGKQENEFGI